MNNLRVLIIDDDPIFMSQHIDYLEEEGFKVTLAANVAAALKAARCEARSIDVVVLDLMMPPGKYGSAATEGGTSTGLLLLEELRQLLPATPIIVLTFTPDFTSVLAKVEATTSVCLQKPILPSQLASVILSVVGNAK